MKRAEAVEGLERAEIQCSRVVSRSMTAENKKGLFHLATNSFLTPCPPQTQQSDCLNVDENCHRFLWHNTIGTTYSRDGNIAQSTAHDRDLRWLEVTLTRVLSS